MRTAEAADHPRVLGSEHSAKQPVPVEELMLRDESDVDGERRVERDMAHYVESEKVVRDEHQGQSRRRNDE